MFDDLAYRFNRVLTETGIREMGRDFGRWLIPFMGETTEGLVRLADASRDVFSMIADGLGDRDVLAGLAFSLSNVLPQLTALTAIVLDALPTIARFSAGMMDMLTSILGVIRQVGRLGEIITWVSGGLVDGQRLLGRTTAAFFALSSAVFVATKIASVYQVTLVQIIASKAKLWLVTNKYTASLIGMIGSKLAATKASWSLAFALGAVQKALAGVLALTGVGLALVAISTGVSWLAGEMMDLEEQTRDATDALQEFDRQQQSMGGYDGVYTGSLDRQTYVDVTDNSQTTITGSSESMTSDAEYANFLDQDRMDQLFS